MQAIKPDKEVVPILLLLLSGISFGFLHHPHVIRAVFITPTRKFATTTLMSAASNKNNIRPISDVQPPRPNACTYWATDHLLAGEHPTDDAGLQATRRKLSQYLANGITYFVDLTRPGEKMDYEELLREEAAKQGISNNNEEEIGYCRVPIPDFGVPEDPSDMTKVLDTIDQAIASNHKVYVHCRGGIGRTGTTVGCYFVRHGSSSSNALQEVNRLFQSSDRSMESYSSPETREQFEFVHSWKPGM